jgi:F-type H+-transporting ATPase subunit delta
MTQIGSVYGGALYALARDEEIADQIREELYQVGEVFKEEPEYLRLLSAANIPRQERCDLVDGAFRDKVHPYVLNFLKILTEKGYAKHFSSCLDAYIRQYNTDNDILPVKAVTAISLTKEQIARLEGKISAITCKKAQVENRVDEQCLGGVLLEYDGTQVDGSVASRMEKIRKLLKNTVL